ncbi:hypothetical protein [Streptomyces pseudogriseolus]|uniref:hypothetical protein n=1 Tax=Streptomyces pseudogriseolus TaxID=36817 RepID=UPI003FA28CD3
MTTTVPFGLAEQTEIAAYTDFVAGAAAPLREALGIGSLHVGSALALAIREDPSRFFNRAGGFGAGEPITVDVVAQVCDFYRRQAVSQGAFMVAPPLQPPHWAATADKVNLTPGNRFVKLGCDIESTLSAADGVAALDPGLRVGPVEPHHAQEWATVMMTTFGFTTPGMIDMAASCVGRPNWRQRTVRGRVRRSDPPGGPRPRSAVGTAHGPRPGSPGCRLPMARRRDRSGRLWRPQHVSPQHAARRTGAALRAPHLAVV